MKWKKEISYASGSRIVNYYPVSDFVREFKPNEKIEDTPYYNDGFDIVAKKNSGGIFYFHNNHLGSTNLITDENKKIVEQTDYQPFGLPLKNLEEKYSFTGREQDNTGLYYFESRYYNPKTMHFTQADTIIPDVYDPLSLNRYSYVRNNPMKYVDPDGHIPIFVFAVLPVLVYVTSVVVLPSINAYFAAEGVEDIQTAIKEPSPTNLIWAALAAEDILTPGIPEGAITKKTGKEALKKNRKKEHKI